MILKNYNNTLIRYQTYNIMPLIANYWNRGVRVFNPTLYLQGDDAR